MSIIIFLIDSVTALNNLKQPDAITSQVLHDIKRLVERAKSLIESLEKAVGELKPTQASNKDKIWNNPRLLYLRKKESLVRLCDQINENKRSLSVALPAITSIQASNISRDM